MSKFQIPVCVINKDSITVTKQTVTLTLDNEDDNLMSSRKIIAVEEAGTFVVKVRRLGGFLKYSYPKRYVSLAEVMLSRPHSCTAIFFANNNHCDLRRSNISHKACPEAPSVMSPTVRDHLAKRQGCEITAHAYQPHKKQWQSQIRLPDPNFEVTYSEKQNKILPINVIHKELIPIYNSHSTEQSALDTARYVIQRLIIGDDLEMILGTIPISYLV